jgi:hypothetical protein
MSLVKFKLYVIDNPFLLREFPAAPVSQAENEINSPPDAGRLRAF